MKPGTWSGLPRPMARKYAITLNLKPVSGTGSCRASSSYFLLKSNYELSELTSYFFKAIVEEYDAQADPSC